MTDENININVKSNIGDVSKDAGNAASEFKVMGVSLNGVKKGFASAAVTAKGMFGSIKAGLISTGIGVFLVAIGALVQYFKDSEEGASKLKQITSALGVVFGNITDVVSNLGKLLFDTFSNPKKAIKDLWDAIKTNLINRVTGLIDTFKAAGKVIEGVLSLNWDKVKEGAAEYGESLTQVATGVDDLFKKTRDGIKKTADAAKELAKQTKKEVAQAVQLEKDRLALQKFEREAIVEKARTEKDMMELRLKARDEENFATEERLEFMREANKLAAEQLQKDLHVAKEKLRFQQEENSFSKSTQENLDAEAQLQAQVFQIERSNFSERKRLKSEEQALVKQMAAQEKARLKEIEDAEKAKEKEIADAQAKARKEKEAAEKEALKKSLELAKIEMDKKIAYAKLVEQEKKKTIAMGFDALGALTEKSDKAQKAVAVAKTIYNTQQAIMNAMANVPAPFNVIQSVATGVMGAASIQKILSTSPASASGGGGSTTTPVSSTPAPQMMSGAFDLSGGVAPEAMKAFVVTDEMTNSQNQLANIRRRATI